MTWLELLARALEGDEPVMVLDQFLPPTVVWWSDDSLPVVRVPAELWFIVADQLEAATGSVTMMHEGEA